MAKLSFVAAFALPLSLVAGLVLGTQPGVVDFANAAGTATSNSLEVAVPKQPLRMPIPSADRLDKGPVVLPAIPKSQKMLLAVSGTTPSANGTYGVGVLPTIKFDQPVPKAARWAIQDSLVVEVTPQMKKPLVWSWLDSQTLGLRPKEFWPQKHTVSIKSTWPTKKRLVRVSPADWTKKRPVPPQRMIDIRMTNEVDLNFNIGREQIFTVDAKTHRGVVTRKGQDVLNVPISLGKSGWETASGVKTLMEFYEVKRLQNLTGPETWSVDAPYSIRLTWSGEFLHSATWNNAIGYANTSHGCTNLTLSDARWFYENSLRGDPVITKNTGRGYRGAWDGDGAPWNVDWKTWNLQSAVAP